MPAVIGLQREFQLHLVTPHRQPLHASGLPVDSDLLNIRREPR